MRSIALKSLFVIMFAFLCSSLFAESVFLTDGPIVEGKIVKETDTYLTLKMTNGLDTTIPRARVIRVIYHDQYKKVVSIHKADNSVIKGYIVDETNDEYFLRLNLDSSKETVIKKKDVDAIVMDGKEKKFSSKASVKTGPKYSIALAVFTSVFPVWSGSFNNGFQPVDWVGITFVLLKSASVIMIGVGFSGEYTVDDDMFYAGLASIALWPLITIADQVFSSVVIGYSKMDGRYSVVNDDESTVAFSFYPRMEYCYDRSLDPRSSYGSIDSGVNIAAVCRW